MTVYLHPGSIRSKTDGQLHFIDSVRLAWLYGVQQGDCVVVNDLDFKNLKRVELANGSIHRYPKTALPQEEDVHYYPLYGGEYPQFNKELT